MTHHPGGTGPARMITAMTVAVVRALRGQTAADEVRANLRRLPPAPALRLLLDALLAALDGAPDAAARLLDEVGPLLGRAAPADAADGLVAIRNLANSLGDRATELHALEGAVAAFRAAGEERATLVNLSVALYNLAMLRASAGDSAGAVALLEEVVALDGRTGSPDLAADQAALEALRKQAATQRPPAFGDAVALWLAGGRGEGQLADLLAMAGGFYIRAMRAGDTEGRWELAQDMARLRAAGPLPLAGAGELLHSSCACAAGRAWPRRPSGSPPPCPRRWRGRWRIWKKRARASAREPRQNAKTQRRRGAERKRGGCCRRQAWVFRAQVSRRSSAGRSSVGAGPIMLFSMVRAI